VEPDQEGGREAADHHGGVLGRQVEPGDQDEGLAVALGQRGQGPAHLRALDDGVGHVPRDQVARAAEGVDPAGEGVPAVLVLLLPEHVAGSGASISARLKEQAGTPSSGSRANS
jgi:hypothetical protein